ncbi:putative RepFIB replication protein A [Escherichia coli]|nr:putative RepFIB replication protein A [Escherichia coli]
MRSTPGNTSPIWYNSAYYDTERDIVQLQADPRLFELYQFDRKVLLQLKAINALKRRESAQALYTFIESLPRDPHQYRWRGCVHASI